MSKSLKVNNLLILSFEPGTLCLLSDRIARSSDFFGAQIFRALSLNEAAAIVRKEKPDAVLALLPPTHAPIEGFAKNIKELLPGLPLIFITDHDDASLETALLENGAQDCVLLENVAHSSFIRRIRSAIARQRYQDGVVTTANLGLRLQGDKMRKGGPNECRTGSSSKECAGLA